MCAAYYRTPIQHAGPSKLRAIAVHTRIFIVQEPLRPRNIVIISSQYSVCVHGQQARLVGHYVLDKRSYVRDQSARLQRVSASGETASQQSVTEPACFADSVNWHWRAKLAGDIVRFAGTLTMVLSARISGAWWCVQRCLSTYHLSAASDRQA